MLSAICFNLDQSKILLSGNGMINTTLKLRLFLEWYKIIAKKGENAG